MEFGLHRGISLLATGCTAATSYDATKVLTCMGSVASAGVMVMVTYPRLMCGAKEEPCTAFLSIVARGPGTIPLPGLLAEFDHQSFELLD